MCFLFHDWKIYKHTQTKSLRRICSKCGRVEEFVGCFWDPFWAPIDTCRTNEWKLVIYKELEE